MENQNKNSSGESGPKTGPLPSLHRLPGSGEYAVNTTWKVDTSIDWDRGVIHQSLSTHSDNLVAWVVATRDAQIRNALIALGWTPPPYDLPSGKDQV